MNALWKFDYFIDCIYRIKGSEGNIIAYVNSHEALEFVNQDHMNYLIGAVNNYEQLKADDANKAKMIYELSKSIEQLKKENHILKSKYELLKRGLPVHEIERMHENK